MRQFDKYQTFIFDCDGVILNSNMLKIDAMKDALLSLGISNENTTMCTTFFSKNFGRSRFFHIEHFTENILNLTNDAASDFSSNLLKEYSSKCYRLYLKAELTLGILEFISKLNGNVFIASGSEENELRAIFRKRQLDVYFDDILGSPTIKKELVSSILKVNKGSKAILFGDSLSDLDAAIHNNIDFAAYLPFSNVREELINKSIKYNSLLIEDWGELL